MSVDGAGDVSASGGDSGFGAGLGIESGQPGGDAAALFDGEVRSASDAANSTDRVRLADGSAYLKPGVVNDAAPATLPSAPTEPPAPASSPAEPEPNPVDSNTPPSFPRVPLRPLGFGLAAGATAVELGVAMQQQSEMRMQQILSGQDLCGGRFFCFTSMLDGSFGGPAPLLSPTPPNMQSDLANGPQRGFAIETRNQEEANLADSMRTEGKTAEEIQNAINELRTHRGDIANLIHQRELGLDPARSQFSAREAATGVRLEAFLNRQLNRDPSGDSDWIDSAGRTYDGVGPVPEQHFDAPAFADSIAAHLRKQGLDHIVVDVTGMRADQISQIDQYIRSLPEQQARRIIRLGF